MEWYDYVKVLMKQRGITQEDLVPVLGITTRGGIGHYLRGERQPSPRQMKNLIDYLDVDFSALFGSEDEHSVKEEIYNRELAKIASKLSEESKQKLFDMAELLSKAEKVSRDE